MKVRMQMSSSSGILSTFREFGGLHSLFRGMAAPLATAAAVNAVVFGSYGFSSRLYDTYIIPEQSSSQSRDQNNNNNDDNDDDLPNHDPWQKAMACGSFAGAVQCVIICPMEHVKCRLQMQQQFQGPMDCIQKIVRDHGVTRLFQGWWTTCWREIPAFGLYFASYDYLKDQANSFFLKRQRQQIQQNGKDSHNLDSLKISNTHTWLSSAFAGGCAGSLTWACVYPVDVIKTRVQTASLDTPFRNLRMYDVGKSIVQKHGVRYLFRGLGITLIRAFPVNGTIFPVYEFTLQQVTSMGY
jgi:solute carrier family 25 carnitine/acylcarnitine transporter 20/29